ncbi:riboflavin synthase [Maridesulfovibrio bastinii]|uniref:riboflavin synthase n=1 Tax=Maridesulfovibrio bastinii TaxID=47157 RepID=UPI0003F5E805|nr:riboflavin synthase [Maridesulfovibrio bastinii]
MFTGLVQTMGRVERIETRGKETRFTIATDISDYVKGESIAINGACLTVETFSGSSFSCYASAETINRTNLGGLRPGSTVNCERAMAVGDRLGGHIVSGHVDCIAKVESISNAGESTIYEISFPEEQGKYVVAKGSVALDGISLTVNKCGNNYLKVNIIPETSQQTTISKWAPGYEINMETDVIGKYVFNMLSAWNPTKKEDAVNSGLTMDFLRENGF